MYVAAVAADKLYRRAVRSTAHARKVNAVRHAGIPGGRQDEFYPDRARTASVQRVVGRGTPGTDGRTAQGSRRVVGIYGHPGHQGFVGILRTVAVEIPENVTADLGPQVSCKQHATGHQRDNPLCQPVEKSG